MKVHLIKARIERLKEKLRKKDIDAELFKWDCLRNYDEQWDLSEIDLYDMFNRSFNSPISQRLWVGEQYDPKTIMLEFLKIDHHFVADMFRDLLDENKDLMMRINRFLFHCDSLLKILNSKDDRFNTHYHGNYKMISIYLTFSYPDKYCIYEYDSFVQYMKAIEANNIPMENDLPKFFMLTNSLQRNFINKDDELLKLYEERFLENQIAPGINNLMAYDLYALEL